MMIQGDFQKILLLLSLLYLSAVKAQSWTYEDPENWGNDFPDCNGYRQSPIELKSRESLVFPLAPIRFENYDLPLQGNVSLVNNGHSVQFLVPATTNGQLPAISGGILKGKYEAVNVHFHWGSNNSKGSEHVIDGVRYDVEMHIVHKNVAYGSVDEASENADGLAVLGVMLKTVDDPYLIFTGLYKVFQQLPNVVSYQSSAVINGRITLGQLLGDLNTKRFYTYSGSLTTPGCAEAVTWIVFPQALAIARAEIAKFWSIQDENGNILNNNFRPLQRRNGRPIFYRNNFMY